ncbi:MAG: LuxR C-terminal-related transcriptional regulator [Gammaproteobacteria bacterium]
MRVLLIDDHALFRIGLEGLLERRHIEVVASVGADEERDLIESLRNGARGYLLKDMDPDELVDALKDIRAGKTVVAPELAPVLARVVQQGDSRNAGQPTPFSELTPREHEILCHLAEGQSNKVIARRLGISDGTVKLHVKAILRKLGVHSRVEAAVIAVEQELCQKPQ